MSMKKTCGALLLGLALMAAMPAATEAAHRHHRGCRHHVGKVYRYHHAPHYYDYGYRDYGYRGRHYDYGYDYAYDYDYDGVDYDAPYVARHGSGRGYDYDYRYRRSYDAPRYYGSRRYGYHYHGRTRCFRPDRPHVYFTLRLF